LLVVSITNAGVVSDNAESTVELRSTALARFYGFNYTQLDEESDFDAVPTLPTGTKFTSASATDTPVGTHAPGDMATGSSSLTALFGSTDVFNFQVSGSATAANAHNGAGFPADGEVVVRSQISFYTKPQLVPNEVFAGKLYLPALPAVPEGVTLRLKLEQLNCCPTTADYTAPHAAETIDMFYGYGYLLSLTLSIVAPFGDDASLDFNFPVEAGPVLPGDYNGNRVVDAADYVLWRNTEGQFGSALAADGSGPTVGVPDGAVNQLDYNFWRSHFGQAPSGASAGQQRTRTQVPEPGIALSLVTMAMVLNCFRRTNRTATNL
jgi:hypothetical protein